MARVEYQGKVYELRQHTLTLGGGKQKSAFYFVCISSTPRDIGLIVRESPRGAPIGEGAQAKALVDHLGVTPLEAAVAVTTLADTLSPMKGSARAGKVKTLLRYIEEH